MFMLAGEKERHLEGSQASPTRPSRRNSICV